MTIKEIVQDAFDDVIKFNYNCPDEEKTGDGPGSCGGKVGDENKSGTSPDNSSSKPEKKSFFSKLFGEKEKSSVKTISWKQYREFSTEDLTKELEQNLKIAKEGSDVDKKSATKNIENINQVLGMRKSSDGYRGNYKVSRKY